LSPDRRTEVAIICSNVKICGGSGEDCYGKKFEKYICTMYVLAAQRRQKKKKEGVVFGGPLAAGSVRAGSASSSHCPLPFASLDSVEIYTRKAQFGLVGTTIEERVG
jgi:hypothetical protein